MRFDIVTIFPNFFDSFKAESLVAKALQKKIFTIQSYDIRKKGDGRHRSVDDRPYGGGPGMILKPNPLIQTLRSIKREKRSRIILLTPGGSQFTQRKAFFYQRTYEQLIFICGRYEGFDARVRYYVDEELSIGPYVLNGGEVAAMVVIESVARLIPRVVGNVKSLSEESFHYSQNIEYPQYTRPEIFERRRVPKILLSGDHKKIAQWKKQHKKKRAVYGCG